MLLSSWRRLVKRTLPSSRRVNRRPQGLRLHCESLEPRCQPSVFAFSTGIPDGKIATISEPSNAHNFNVEYESADDFVLPTQTVLTHATFTGLLIGGATLNNVSDVTVEIYRVFPKDSDVGRTSGPPVFSTPKVPTRVNSPSDVAFESRDSAAGELSFRAQVLSTNFTAQKSVSSAHKISVGSGGTGPATGVEVEFDVDFGSHPFELPADHYFFVPGVGLTTGAPAHSHFLWLSAPKPIVPPGTPFPTGATDLQSWMRDDPNLAPDWLRIGTDIIGGTAFNATFSLAGESQSAAPGGKAAANLGRTVSSLLEEPIAQALTAGGERGVLKSQPLVSTDNVAAVTALFSQSDDLEKVSLSQKSASAHDQSLVEAAFGKDGIASASLEFSTSV